MHHANPDSSKLHPSTMSFSDVLARYGANNLLIDETGIMLRYSDVIQLAQTTPFQATRRALVFCLPQNEIGGLAGYLALLAAESVPLMVSPELQFSQIESLAADYRPDYVWLPESRAGEWTQSTVLARCHGYCLLALPGTQQPLHPSLALLLSTSGSTGSGKYVRLSMQNLLANAESIASYLELTADELPITTLPPTYSYALSVIHSHLLVGATIAVTAKTFFDRAFWNFFRETQVTSMAGVPYHYEILNKLRFAKMSLPSLRTLTQAGGRMEPELTRHYAVHCFQNGMRFFTMYGQTEATARMSYVPADQAQAKAGSVGVAIPRGAFELHDEHGAILAESGATGELVYRGPNVCMGYANSRADLALGDENHGVLRTGDLAQRDPDGYYSIVGRKNRFIKLFGNRINLQDVEQLLSAQDIAAACTGRDDALEIYLAQADVPQALHIKKGIASSLQVGLPGIAVYGVDVLPRSESGKIRYAELTPAKGQLLA
jgi:long-chain acyl-CoA synthetase